MLNLVTPRRALLVLLAVAVTAIVTAWIFQFAGFAPCELCLKQRWAYYAAIPLTALLLALPPLQRPGLVLLALLWLGSTIFGIYHAGVEWKWWQGPSDCTGTGQSLTGLPDLTSAVVMCDEAAIRIFGLSLAGWNALVSLVLALLALAGARSQGSSSVSQ